MKKLLPVFIAVGVVVIVGLGILIGSILKDSNDAIQNIKGDEVLAYHDCEITLTSYETPIEGEPAVFKSDISVSDITLAGDLVGKNIESVTFVNSSTVKLVLTGKVNNLPEETGLGEIIVSGRAVENGYDSCAFVPVVRAQIKIASTNTQTHNSQTTKTIKYRLTAGSFASEIASEVITISENATLQSVSLEGDLLCVVIVYEGNPSDVILTLAPSATSFNKEVQISAIKGIPVVME